MTFSLFLSFSDISLGSDDVGVSLPESPELVPSVEVFFFNFFVGVPSFPV